MKRLILITMLISFAQLINAQEDAISRNFVLGGSMNFLIQNNTYPLSSLSINSGIGGVYSNSTTDSKNTRFAFTPYVGMDIKPHLLVGVQLEYHRSNFYSEQGIYTGQAFVDLERNSNQYGISLFSRYTVNPDKQFNFYIQPYIGYNFLNEEAMHDSVLIDTEKASFIELGFGLGVLYNINNSIRATLRTGGLHFVKGKWERASGGQTTENDFSSFGTNLNLSTIYFGFEIKI